MTHQQWDHEQRQAPEACPEPHHHPHADEAAHRAHHWKERLFCLGCCTALHFILEGIAYVWSK
jgi:hypothetical protein